MTKLYRIPPVRFDSEPMDAGTLSQQIDWGLRERSMPEVWSRSAGEGVLVIVCDTGVPNHKDLPDAVFTANFTNSPDPDRNAHQTHCSGIIAALNNDDGVVGWSPKVDIAHIKVLGDSGAGATTWITAGIRKAIEEWNKRKKDYVGCVISLSIGGPFDRGQEAACAEANDAGIIVVAAAGNSGANAGIDSPGDFATTLGTAAYRRDGEIARFSSGGPEVDFAMPGEQILSTVPGNRYQVMSGTSMATPALAGLCACVLSSHPHDESLRHYEGMKKHLSQNVEDRGSLGKDNRFGIGVPSVVDSVRDQEFWFF